MNTRKWASRARWVEFSLMHVYMFCFGFFFQIWGTTKTTMTTTKISNIRPPKRPNFLLISYFSYTYFSNTLNIQAKFREVAKYIIL